MGMAPSKKAVPAKVAKVTGASLEGPVSLLWAYQLRREHSLLLTRIDGLVETVSSVAPLSMLREIKHDAQIAAGRATAVENEVQMHGLDLQAISERISGRDEIMADLQNQMTDMARHHKETIDSLVRQQQSLLAHVEPELENSFELNASEQQEEMRKLASGKKALDSRIGELSNEEVSIVHDSLRDSFSPDQKTATLGQAKQRHNGQSFERRRSLLQKPVSHAEELLRELDNNGHEPKDSDIFALRPIGQMDETLDDEFDLDQNVASLSYACHFHRRMVPEESMKMLPELQEIVSQPPNRYSLTSLKQTASQTWEAYLRRGEEYIKSSPKRKEGAIVDSFVEGVLDPLLRSTCELWLDERTWIWENVKTFAATCHQLEETPDLSSTLSPSPLSQKESEEMLGALKRVQVARNEPAKHLKNQNLPETGFEQSANQNQICGYRYRRSQRIFEKESQKARHTLKLPDPIAPPARRPTSKKKADTATTFPQKESRQPTQLIPNTAQCSQKNRRKERPQGLPPRMMSPAQQVRNAAAQMKTPVQNTSIDALCQTSLPVVSQKRKFELQERHISKKRFKLSRKKRGRAPIIPILPSSDIDPGDGRLEETSVER